MSGILEVTASIAGILGAIVCLLSGLGRLTGLFHLAGFELSTVFISGVGLMVFAILLKLEVIHRHIRSAN